MVYYNQPKKSIYFFSRGLLKSLEESLRYPSSRTSKVSRGGDGDDDMGVSENRGP